MTRQENGAPLQSDPARVAGAVGIALGCLLSLDAGPVAAADWSFDPKVVVSAEYDDNNRLTNIPGNEVEVSGAKLDALLRMSARTPRTTFSLTPRLRSTFYPSEPQDEANDQFLRMALEHKTKRMVVSLDAGYSSVVTLGSYFPSSVVSQDSGGGDLGDPNTGVGTGTVSTRNRENQFRVRPAASFELTQRQVLELGAEYLDTQYEKSVSGDQQDYSSLSVRIAYRYRTSETASLGLIAGVGQYEPDSGDNRTAYGLNAEWAKRWSDTAEVYMRGGANFVESVQPGRSGTDSGLSGGAGVRWAFEVTDIFLDANQYLDPSSSGTVVTRSQLRFQISRKLSPTTVFSLGVRAIDDSGAPGDDGYQGRKYATGDIGLRWRMTRQFTLFGRYQYRWKKLDGSVGNADSNGVSLGVAWEPNRK